eukprot:gene30341-35341_t
MDFLQPPDDISATNYLTQVLLEGEADGIEVKLDAGRQDAMLQCVQVLLEGAADGIEVKLDAGPNRGKGIFTTRNFSRGDTLFKERPLVGIQHASSKEDSLVCAHCFKFIGSVEQQIARKLLLVIQQHRELEQQKQAPGSGDNPGLSGSSTEAEAANDGDGEEELRAKMALISAAEVGEEYLKELLSGAVKLPYSEEVPLLQPVPCTRVCGEQYCSTSCASEAWDQYHCLLCCGGGGCGQGGSSSSADHEEEVVCGLVTHRNKLPAFIEHAHSTNEIFELAAKVAAVTLTRLAAHRDQLPTFIEHTCSTYEIFELAAKVVAVTLTRCWRATQKGGGEGAENSAPLTMSQSSPGMKEAWLPYAMGWEQAAWLPFARLEASLEAWLPFAMGWKQVWWECVAVPEDVDNEGEFREQLK